MRWTMKVVSSMLIGLASTLAVGQSPPPPAAPASPQVEVADEDGTVENPEPVPVINAPAQATAGTMIKVAAHGSRNGYNYSWLVIPPLPYEVSDDGRTCMFAHPKPGKFTFVLAVSTQRGKVAMTTVVVTLTKLPDEDEETISEKPSVQALAKPEPKVTLSDLEKKMKGFKDAPAKIKLATALRLVGGAALTGQITSVEEFERAISTHTNGIDEELVEAAVEAVDLLAGEDENWSKAGDACHKIANFLDR